MPVKDNYLSRDILLGRLLEGVHEADVRPSISIIVLFGRRRLGMAELPEYTDT